MREACLIVLLWGLCCALVIITACKRSLRRLCFHRCLSVHGGGCVGGVHAMHAPCHACLPAMHAPCHTRRPPPPCHACPHHTCPPAMHVPPCTPPAIHAPLPYMPPATYNPLPCTPPDMHTPLPYDMRSMSGRYASYWNAFFLLLNIAQEKDEKLILSLQEPLKVKCISGLVV